MVGQYAMTLLLGVVTGESHTPCTKKCNKLQSFTPSDKIICAPMSLEKLAYSMNKKSDIFWGTFSRFSSFVGGAQLI